MSRANKTLYICRRVLLSSGSRTTKANRSFATAVHTSPVSSTERRHKVVVVGGGSAGLSVSHQLLRSGKFRPHEIAIVDPAQWHHYQPGWTLVGGGLKDKEQLRRPLASLIDPKLQFYQTTVKSFSPEHNSVLLGDRRELSYEQLVVAPGIALNIDAIAGLKEALDDPGSKVSSIYSYDTCDKAYRSIQAMTKGDALFTQPTGVVKCAGAPQKIMWLALDYWKKKGFYNPSSPSTSPTSISFATGLAGMFGVQKYSAALNQLRQQRGVEALFQHDLKAIKGDTATFALPDGKEVERHFDFLHVVPKMGAHEFVSRSFLANEAGFVDVDNATLRHKKYANVWSCGDASSLPTSKTAAAITAQAPVLVRNLLLMMEAKECERTYNGYTSCPLLTEYGKVMLAEFKYDGVPEETFNKMFGVDQAVPRRSFYHLKKDFFPWVYYQSMMKGTWGGAKGWLR